MYQTRIQQCHTVSLEIESRFATELHHDGNFSGDGPSKAEADGTSDAAFGIAYRCVERAIRNEARIGEFFQDKQRKNHRLTRFVQTLLDAMGPGVPNSSCG